MKIAFLRRFYYSRWHFVRHKLVLGVYGIRTAEHLQRVTQDILVSTGWIDYLLRIFYGDLTLDRFDQVIVALLHASRYSSIRWNSVFLFNEVTGFYTTATFLLRVLLHWVVIWLLCLILVYHLHVGVYNGVGKWLAMLEFLRERDTTYEHLLIIRGSHFFLILLLITLIIGGCLWGFRCVDWVFLNFFLINIFLHAPQMLKNMIITTINLRRLRLVLLLLMVQVFGAKTAANRHISCILFSDQHVFLASLVGYQPWRSRSTHRVVTAWFMTVATLFF